MGDTKTQVEVVQEPSTGKETLPHITQSAVQSMVVKYTNWKCTHAEITDAETQDVLCIIDFKMRKPHLIFNSSQPDSEWASSVFHLTSRRVDVDIRGQKLELKAKGVLNPEYSYSSPALGQQTLTWKCGGGWKAAEYVCLDERQMPLARFEISLASVKSLCKVELLGSVGDDRAAKEEILVMGMSLVYQYVVNHTGATAAAVS